MSNEHEEPSDKQNQQYFMNKQRFCFKTDPMEQPGAIRPLKEPEPQVSSKYLMNGKPDMLDIKKLDELARIQKQMPNQIKNKQQETNISDYVYVAFTSQKGCCLNV